jgi:hypothetical protein
MKYRIEWIEPSGDKHRSGWAADKATALYWAGRYNEDYPDIHHYVVTDYSDPEAKKAAIEKGRSKSWAETAQQAPLSKPTQVRGVCID